MDEVIALAPDAKEHYDHAMESGNHIPTFVFPFEVFPTKISFGPNNAHVMTDMIGIASTSS